MFRTLLVIGVGGFFGSIGRYLVQLGAGKIFSPSFPAGTFLANIIGCLVIGMVYAMAEKGNLLSAEMRLFLAVGFCGGFTTFSSFANDNLMLLKGGSVGLLLLNVIGSVVLGIFAVYLGIVFIRSII
jgi:fluoride exporter